MKIIIKSEKQKDYALSEINKLGFSDIHEVTIKQWSPDRSLAQNSLFHKWVGIAAIKRGQQTGEYFSPAAWKHHFKEMFLGFDVIKTPSGPKEVLKHTSELNTKEMAEFMTKVDHYCGEHNIQLPHPQDYGWLIGAKK